MIVRRKQQLAGCGGDALRAAEALPEVIRGREVLALAVAPVKEIVLDNAVAVRRVRELEPQNLSVVLGLLKAVAGFLVRSFGFYDGDWEITAVAEQVVRALLGATALLAACNNDPPVGKRLLLADLFVVPPCGVKLRQHVFPASVGLGESGHAKKRIS